MNKEEAKQFLPLVQALVDKKQVQENLGSDEHPDWVDTDRIDTRNHPSRYRIKPEPRRIWVNEYESYIFGYTEQYIAEANATRNAKRIAVEYVEVIK